MTTRRMRGKARRKKWSVNANRAKARKRMESANQEANDVRSTD